MFFGRVTLKWGCIDIENLNVHKIENEKYSTPRNVDFLFSQKWFGILYGLVKWSEMKCSQRQERVHNPWQILSTY